jgi:hypothetical protein
MGDSVVSASAARQAIPDLTGISHRLFPLLQHMLEPDPQMRPADMGVVLRMLDDPSLIPSRYRLPLWAGSDDSGAATPRGPGSDSPFASFTRRSNAPPRPAPAPPAAQEPGCGLALGRWCWLPPAGWGPGFMRPAPAPLPDPEPARARDAGRARHLYARGVSGQPDPAALHHGRADILGAEYRHDRADRRGPHDGAALADAYDRAFGTRATVLSPAVTGQINARRSISCTRCPAARRPRPICAWNAREADGSVQIQGSVGDGRRSQPVAVSGRPGGEVYDLTAQLSAPDANSRAFGFALSSGGGTEPVRGRSCWSRLSSGLPLTQVAAAPSGVPGGDILPAVLDELRQAGDAPAVAFRVVEPTPE